MNKTAKDAFDLARMHKIESDSFLTICIQTIARQKGFTDEESLLFNANWASCFETIVTYNECGEMGDLDIMTFDTMTKEQIVKHFEKHNEL